MVICKQRGDAAHRARLWMTVQPTGRMVVLACALCLLPAICGASQPVSFVKDVLPVLTKAGCNAGACHAKKEGQNGFKLSVFAYDPESDYQEIVHESRGRRVSPAAPEESLILKKPTMTISHSGGRRFEPGSRYYETVLAWIKQGMPYRLPEEPNLDRISVTPGSGHYTNGAAQPLQVIAHYSDGSEREVTALAEYDSMDKDIATVDEAGEVVVGELEGEGIVVARFMGQVEIARITVPAAQPLPDTITFAIHNEIDRLVFDRLKALGIAPSTTCSDAEFLRRATLDVAGRLPGVEEAREFLGNNTPDKRERWVDKLLKEPGYADHWAVKWGDLIRPNPARVGIKSVYLLDLWMRDQFRQNRPYDELVRELLGAQGSTHRNPPAVIFRDHREPHEVGAFVSRIFMGVRMECAQCHHHPSEKWSQDDYYHLAAFFAQTKRKGQGISAPISGLPEYIYHAPGGKVRHPVTGKAMDPKPPGDSAIDMGEDADPRLAFLDWLCDTNNPFFAKAVVNRVWAELMGPGLVEPVDDFRASNPPSNEPLLEWLAADFTAHGHDMRHLIRRVMTSHVYQLSSLPSASNTRDLRNYSRKYRRRLDAEVLLDAVLDFTETTENFDGLRPGARAIHAWNNKLDSDFMDAFGRPDSSAECPCERDPRTSVVQALHLMNSRDLQGRLSADSGRAARLAAGELEPDAIITELYLAAYARAPLPEELSRARLEFEGENADRRVVVEDLMWALVNSAEFVFNH